MKSIKRALKALLITVLAYLVQVCVMKYLTFQGVTGSVVFAVLSVIIVSCGKKYAFCASCIVGMMMECMISNSNVPGLYVIAYPVITMLCAQYFSDMTERQMERRRAMIELRSLRISEGKGKDHWWHRFLLRYRETDMPPVIRIPLGAGVMDLLMNAALCAYMYLIGVDLSLIHVGRAALSVMYTVALALALMIPLRYALGMYRKRRKREGGIVL